MDLRRLTVAERAVIAGLLSILLAFSGVDMRGIALALDGTPMPVESSEKNEAAEPNPEAAAAKSDAPEQDVDDSASGSTEPTPADGQAASRHTLTAAENADSISVETFELSWVTQDTKVAEEGLTDEDPTTLELIPGYSAWNSNYVGDDDALEMQASLHISLSGEGSCKAGAMQITLPARFVKDRDGAYLGAVAVDVPEEPDGSQDLAYRLVTPDDGAEPYLIITNMRALDAGTAYDIDITVSGITPHEVKSGETQHGLEATVSLADADGGDTSRESNELTATIATQEGIGSAQLNGGAVVEMADAPEAIRNALGTVASAAGKGEGDYVLVRWNAYVSAEGNQAFTLGMEDKLTGTNNGYTWPAVKDTAGNTVDSTGSVVLGTSTEAANPASDTYEKAIIYNGYIPSGETCYETVWTAYPKSLFADGAEYKLGNTVTWILKPTDTQESETIFKSAYLTYTKPTEVPFETGTSYYSISKETAEPHRYPTSSNTALSELAAGADATIGFTVTGTGEIMGQTKAAGESTPDVDIAQYINDGSKTIDDYYHKRSVTVEVADDAVYLNGNYASELGSADYHVSRVDLQDPYVYTYAVTGTGDAAKWDYVRDTAGRLPDMALYGLSEATGGTAAAWTKLATVSYAEDNARTVAAVVDGVAADSDGVTLDGSLGITRVKLVSSSKDYDKVQLRYSPSITLHATSTRVQQLVASRFAYSDTPVATLRNDATLLAYHGDALGGTDDDAPSIDPATAKISSSEVIALTRNYTPTAEMKRTDEMDQTRYGGSMEHGTSLAYLRGAVPRIGVTSTKAMAYDATTDLDATAMQAKLHYSATVHEQSNITSRELYDSFVADGSIVAETSGTWYDLLPAGVEPVISSIVLREGDAIEDAYAIRNYKDSGRTLLVVQAKLVPVPRYNDAVSDDASGAGYWAQGFYDEPQISFDAVYSYAGFEAGDDGKDQLDNVIAFESGNSALGDVDDLRGEPDDATLTNRTEYNNRETAAAVTGVEELMSDLDATRDAPTFVYARSTDGIEVNRGASSATKTVASDAEGIYRTGTGEEANQVNVYAGQDYTYRINVGAGSDSTDVVVYDALEGYEPAGEDGDAGISGHSWKGALASVDTSGLAHAGVAPVVYYSTTVTSSDIESHTDLTDSTSWSQEPPANLSDVTAIAVDCRKSSDGGDYTLAANTSLPVYTHMTAPVENDSVKLFGTVDPNGDEDDADSNSHAFNKAYVASSAGGSYTPYTKVGILPFKVSVSKVWDDGDNQDGIRPESVTVNLLANGAAATDADGNAVGSVTLGSAKASETGYSDGGWTYSFANLPYADGNGAIRYTVVEDDVTGPDGAALYTPSYQRLDDTHLRIVNKRASDTVDVCGAITWNDDGDNAGARPSTVMVRLYADGMLTSSKRVTPDSGGRWSYSFTGLPARSDGKRIVYTVQQDAVDSYATDYSASQAGSGSDVADDGTIEGSADITNTYSATGYLAIEKTVEGAKSDASKNASFPFAVELFDPALKDENGSDPLPLYGSYHYTVKGPDGVTVTQGRISTGGTIELAAGQRAVIGNIPAGSTYKVTEQPTDGFTPISAENLSGSVTAGPDEEHAVAARFVNGYSSTGSFQLQATKALTGQRLARHQFQFQAYQVFNEGTADEYEQLVGTASNLAGGSPDAEGRSSGAVYFSRTNVSNDDLGEDGTLTLLYRIREVIPDDATDNGDRTCTYGGYTWATNVEQVRVTLADDGSGGISATQTPEAKTGTSKMKSGDTYTESEFTSNGTATFDNVYTATGRINLVAYKSLIGRAQVADEFTFDLAALTAGAPTADDMAATNDADGTITFPEIALGSADVGKTYVYQVSERAGEDAGVNYSSAPVYLRVDVADDGAGNVSGTVQAVSPKADAEDEKVAAGDPSAFEATGGSATITNTLKPGTLTIEKKLAEGTADDDNAEFTFKVRLIGPHVASSYTYGVDGSSEKTTAAVTDGEFEVKLKGGQTATIEDIAAGTAYQVFEESAEGWQLDGQTDASGTIEADGLSAATFTNKKAGDAVTAHLYASKALDGAAPANDAYSFKLTGTGDAPMPDSATEGVIEVSNDAAGLADFGPVTYTQTGTYTYRIAEVAGSDEAIVYDDSSWTATVTVEDTDDTAGVALSASVSYAEGTGTASSTAPLFSNTSKPGTLTVTKNGVNVTTDNEDTAFEFAVELLREGEPVTSATYYVTDPDNPTSATSPTGVYRLTLKPGQTATFTDLPAGTAYHVSESGQPNGWTQTASSQTQGRVPPGGTIASSTTSTYAATGSLSLRATKTMEVGGLSAGQFGFELLDGDGNVVQSVANLAPGTNSSVAGILFDQIDYDVSDLFVDGTDDGIDNPTYDARTYTYTMREVVPDEATNAEGTTWASANDEQKVTGGFAHEGVIYGSDAESDPISQAVYVEGGGHWQRQAARDAGGCGRKCRHRGAQLHEHRRHGLAQGFQNRHRHKRGNGGNRIQVRDSASRCFGPADRRRFFPHRVPRCR